MKLKIKVDPIKGRGVYTEGSIRKGSIIEVCQLLILSDQEVQGKLEGYVYEFSDSQYALALGNGSLYNHSDNPNAAFEMDYEKRLLTLKALKSIKDSEEIVIDYGYDEVDKKRFGIS
jgi:hypothetical protein